MAGRQRSLGTGATEDGRSTTFFIARYSTLLLLLLLLLLILLVVIAMTVTLLSCHYAPSPPK